jgi:hypothetical protein
MSYLIYIDGGAGRVICSIPALEKHHLAAPEKKWHVLVPAWSSIFWGNKLLQDRVFDPDQKGVFDQVVRQAQKIISPEPYRIPDYFNQNINLCEAFDREINNTLDHTDILHPTLDLTPLEKQSGMSFIKSLPHKKTIVFQPFGSTCRILENDVVDDTARSINYTSYLEIIDRLKNDFNIILFCNKNLWNSSENNTIKVDRDLRGWFEIIQNCDYFIGVDSVGQHIARAFDKPGTVILGSTFKENVTYPDFFSIVETKLSKKYAPIRICNFDSHLVNLYNDQSIILNQYHLNEIFKNVYSHFEN